MSYGGGLVWSEGGQRAVSGQWVHWGVGAEMVQRIATGLTALYSSCDLFLLFFAQHNTSRHITLSSIHHHPREYI